MQKLVPGIIPSVPADIAVIGQCYVGSNFAFCAGRAALTSGLDTIMVVPRLPRNWLLMYTLAKDWRLATTGSR